MTTLNDHERRVIHDALIAYSGQSIRSQEDRNAAMFLSNLFTGASNTAVTITIGAKA